MPEITHAISIRQPYVELILQGRKIEEYRSVPTRIRGRVYIYTAKKPADNPEEWERVGAEPGSLPTGAIVGTVEIVGCEPAGDGDYAFVLRKPRRLEKALHAVNHPQPCFWIPSSLSEKP